MKYTNLSLPSLFISTGLLMASVFSFPARTETIDCTAITTLPYTITTQGVYCLTGNLSTSIASGNAITINANNVTLDLNGWRLGGLAAGRMTDTYGVSAFARKNVTVKNGTTRGFRRGVSLGGVGPCDVPQGYLVEDIRAEQNTRVGIHVCGRGSIVRRNQVVEIGGDDTSQDDALGISIGGTGSQLTDNTIVTIMAAGSGFATGVYAAYFYGGFVKNNRITNVGTTGSGTTYGIWHVSGSNALFVGNMVTNTGDYGFSFNHPPTKYMNNLTSDVSTAYSGGTAVGTND